MALLFRNASLEDAAACAEIYRPYVEKTAISFEYVPPTTQEMAERMRHYTEKFPWIVAERDGKIIGYGYACAQNVREAYQWNADLSIYLEESCCGKGLGRALYSCLIDLLAAQGYLRVFGIVTKPNEKSEAMHRSLDFTSMAVCQKAGYKLGEWRDVQWYIKEIGPYEESPKPPTPMKKMDAKLVESLFQKYVKTVEEK